METSIEGLSLSNLALVYAAGFATSLTPCIYPMIPITIGYLGGQTGGLLRRFFSALAYVLGLSLVYTILGFVAAMTGTIFGTLTTNAYVYLFFGIFLLFLGGTMMDWYQVPLPQWLQPKPGGEGVTSPLACFLVGATSGFVAVPCAAPVLAGLLLYIATEREILAGGIMMFVFSLGFSTLLLVLGISLGFTNRLPRSGHWMNIVKKALGVVLMGTAIYFIFKAGQLS